MNEVLNIAKRYQLPYLLLLFALITLTVLRLTALKIGFCTAWDEAYFLLKLREAYDMSFITGKSQWNLLAIHWFPFLDLTNPVHSRIAAYLCEILGSIIVTLTCMRVYGKQHVLKCFTISYLLFFQIPTSYVGGSLNYVPMQALLLILALCSIHLYYHSTSKCCFAWLLLTGISMGISVFVIMPSGVLLIGCTGALLLIRKDWRAIVSFVLGICFALLYMHFFICSLPKIYEAMRFTFTYFTKSGYKYSPMDFCVALGLLARDGMLCLLVCCGIYCLFKYVSQWNKTLAAVLFMLLTFLYYYYQVKPQTDVPLVIISYILILIFDHRNIAALKMRNKNVLYPFFLLSFPLIASIGTNTYLGCRMACFASSWLLLYMDYMDLKVRSCNVAYRVNTLLVTVVVLLLMKITPNIISKAKHREDNHFTRGSKAFSELSLTASQTAYLNRVLDVMEEYEYLVDSSIVFTTEYDYSTVYALEARLSSNFYQKRNFLYFPKEKMLKPDFIFLCEWDKIEIGDALREMPWGWPQQFDSTFVGSPEGDDFPWDSNRWLYCRKN